MPRILITRTRPGADKLATKLEAAGFTATCCPLLQVEQIAETAVLGGKEQGLILTSVAAISGLPKTIGQVPLYCVGAQTAAQAKAAGYENIVSGTGNGRALAKVIARSLDPKNGSLLWCRGEIADTAMDKALRKAGFEMRQHICYASRPLPALPEAMQKDLADGKFDVVLFHSRRGAESFRKLKPQLGTKTQALAFSSQISEVLKNMPFAQIEVCPQPNDQSLVAALCRMFSLS
jgi:uroporphyrinogen-III synthase